MFATYVGNEIFHFVTSKLSIESEMSNFLPLLVVHSGQYKEPEQMERSRETNGPEDLKQKLFSFNNHFFGLFSR